MSKSERFPRKSAGRVDAVSEEIPDEIVFVNDPERPPRSTEPQVSPPCEIQLQNPGRNGSVPARRLRPWLAALVAELAPTAGSLGVRFLSDQEMRRLNATWRLKDRPTDVLSFPGELRGIVAESVMSAPSPRGEVFTTPRAPDSLSLLEASHHLGDIAISVPTARRQARCQDHCIEREFKTLLLHGLLHCLGYDHETDDGTMKRLESRLRVRWIDDD